MSQFALKTLLPSYLARQQERIEAIARDFGLDPFPTIFEILAYDQMTEIASYGGFPTRYPHWRFGMEYEQLSKSHEYGLSKIYEMVINNTPGYAYLLEGNSLTDQKLVMAHVYAHVDFFKNNFAFRATDLDTTGNLTNPMSRPEPFEPNRRWIDKMANHGARIRRHMERQGVSQVEEFIDTCLSLDNLVDPWRPFSGRPVSRIEEPDETDTPEVPRLKAKDYMDPFINPKEYLEQQKHKIEEAKSKKKTFPDEPVRDVLSFLLENAPLSRWERDVLEVIHDEAYYFIPQMQTKIMNEGWATYWHSRMMTEKILDASEIIDYADNASGVTATSNGQLNPYKLGVELFRNIAERWDKGQFGKDWDECNDLEVKRDWDMRLGLGQKKIFEVRQMYNDVTFIDEFLTPEFAIEQKMFTYAWSERNGRFEIDTREFHAVKEKLLTQLTNFGNPYIYVENANHRNRSELLLRHRHEGADLRADYAREALRALFRIWKRPVVVATVVDERQVHLSYDGKEHKSEEVCDDSES
ncbi:MAG: SpoVR family protein [Sorangium cellulosum]|nr:MAG: SpoVR family protein [Sorangium cellulosum]